MTKKDMNSTPVSMVSSEISKCVVELNAKRLNRVSLIFTGITNEEQLFLHKMNSKLLDEVDKRKEEDDKDKLE